MNGPTGTTDKTVSAINETTQHKKLRHSPKQNSKKGKSSSPHSVSYFKNLCYKLGVE